jgi:hypothetical protein
MAFIDKDDIRLRKLHPVRSHTSPIERLHSGNLNDRLRPGLFVATGFDDAGDDVKGVFEFVSRLRQ